MDEMRNLMTRKDEMEKELTNSRKFLEEARVGMNGPLTDSEGYPRADIDLYAVRNARQRVNCLTNDLRDLMKQIEERLYELHGVDDTTTTTTTSNGHSSNGKHHAIDETKVDEQHESINAGNADQPAPHRTSNEPFLKIDQIVQGSPSSTAGLNNGDLVIQFGSLCKTNFSQMQQVADIVQNSVGRPIRLTVLRHDHPIRISLTPKTWTGQGLLGCRATPFRE